MFARFVARAEAVPLVKTAAACVAIAGSAYAAAAMLAPHGSVLTTIHIAASPAQIWAVLADTDRYGEWNPHMRLTGTLVPGGVIKNAEFADKHDEPQVFWPTLLVVQPEHELRWLGRYMGIPGLFEAEHYFALHPDNAGTSLIQGEHFSGVGLWLFDPNNLLPAFNEVNAALKARVEMHQVCCVSAWTDKARPPPDNGIR